MAHPEKSKQRIEIDFSKNLHFKSEKELLDFFAEHIKALESEYMSLNDKGLDVDEYDGFLEPTLDDPDEVWEDSETFTDFSIYHFIRMFEYKDTIISYVASTYMNAENEPTFIFLHFGSEDEEVIHNYRRCEQVYDRSYEKLDLASIPGDSLTEGDSLAVALFQAVIKLRSDKDISLEDFKNYSQYREGTIEEADEIWKSTDLSGNTIVRFIKDISEEVGTPCYYVAVTLEDPASSVHSLLFSFPTQDNQLVERYRYGESLHAEEVVQESSH